MDAKFKNVSVRIRWMIRRDMEEVLEIERHAWGEHGRTEEEFLTLLRRRTCIGMVAEEGDRVVGFMLYELHRRHLQVIDMAVHPGWRRRTVGRQMLGKLKGKLSSHRRTGLRIDVPERELDAQLWLKRHGFTAYGMALDLQFPGDHVFMFKFELPAADETFRVDDSHALGGPHGRFGGGDFDPIDVG
jgi:ribosomal-protein-alanine N-acetyltransferase